MSTGTAESVHKKSTFHVPVDRFEIVYGPGVRWEVTRQRLAQSTPAKPIYASFVFTLKTAASDAQFKRELRLATISKIEGAKIYFTAIFSGKIVSGAYDALTRTGYFTLD